MSGLPRVLGERVTVSDLNPAALTAGRGPARCPAASRVSGSGQADPERDRGRGERDVLAEVQAQRREPGPANAGVQAATVLGDCHGLGDGDGGDRVGPGQGGAAGEPEGRSDEKPVRDGASPGAGKWDAG